MRLKEYGKGVLTSGSYHPTTPVAFHSKALSPTLWNYEIYDKEMLTIMEALAEWRHLLLGARQTFEIWTDHQKLQYFWQPQRLNWWQACWVTELADYDYTLHHKLGKQKSNRGIYYPEDQIITWDKKTTKIAPMTFRALEAVITHDPLVPELKDPLQKLDSSAKQALESKDKKWKESDSLIFYNNHIYVPKNHKLQEQIIWDHHDNPLAGHPGCYKTQELIQRNYWWPQMQKWSISMSMGISSVKKIKLIDNPYMLHLILMTFLNNHGKKSQQTWLDHSPNPMDLMQSKCSQTCNTCRTHTPQTRFANLIQDREIQYHSFPEVLISDWRPQTVAKAWEQICKQLSIKQHLSTGYHPKTDSQTERANQEVEVYLCLFINYLQDNWSEWCAIMEFSYNNWVHSMTKQLPFFFVDHGYHPYTRTESQRDQVPSATEWVHQLSKVRQEAEATLALAKVAMKQQFDKHCSESWEYKPGDLVRLEGTNIKTQWPTKKLNRLWHGPFVITEKQLINSNYCKILPGDENMMSSTKNYLRPSLNPLLTYNQMIHQHHLIWLKKKRNTKLKPSLIVAKRDNILNIWSNGKATLMQKTHGNHVEMYIMPKKKWKPATFHKQYPNKPKPTSSNQGIIFSSNCTIFNSFKPMFNFTTPSWGPWP